MVSAQWSPLPLRHHIQRRKMGFKHHRAKPKHQLPWATIMPAILASTKPTGPKLCHRPPW